MIEETDRQADRQILTGGIVVDAIELFRTGSGDQLTCCAARPTGSNTIHRKVTIQTFRKAD